MQGVSRTTKRWVFLSVVKFARWLIHLPFLKYWFLVASINIAVVFLYSFLYLYLVSAHEKHFYFPAIQSDPGYLELQYEVKSLVSLALLEAAGFDSSRASPLFSKHLNSELHASRVGEGIIIRDLAFQYKDNRSRSFGFLSFEICEFFDMFPKTTLKCEVKGEMVDISMTLHLQQAFKRLVAAEQGGVDTRSHYWNTILWMSVRGMMAGVFLSDPKPKTWQANIVLLSQQMIGWVLFAFVLAPRFVLFVWGELKDQLMDDSDVKSTPDR